MGEKAFACSGHTRFATDGCRPYPLGWPGVLKSSISLFMITPEEVITLEPTDVKCAQPTQQRVSPKKTNERAASPSRSHMRC